MNEGTDQRALYLMGRAQECIEDGDSALERGHPESAVNRAYYAIFYAASALLEARDLQAGRHASVIRLFGREFVATGLMKREHGRALGTLFRLRQDADYVRAPTTTAEKAAEQLDTARSFVEDTEALLPKLLKRE